MADFGAEVIKVEPLAGDPARDVLPKVGESSAYFVQHNAGKRCLSLDLRAPEGRHVLQRLVARSDVLLENFRPGVMDRLQLGVDQLMEHNPQLVCCSVSGYGQTGRWAERRAFAPLVHAETGLLEMGARRRAQTRDEAVPVQPEVHSHGDVYSAVMAAMAVILALFDRQSSGVGRRIDLSMAETLFYVNEWVGVELAGGGEIRQLFGAWNSPILRLRGGEEVAFSGNPVFSFPRWVKAMDRPELLEDPRFSSPTARQEHRGEVISVLQEFVERFETAAEVEAALESQLLPVGQVRTVAECADSEWAQSRDLMAEPLPGIRVPRAPWRWDGGPVGVKRAVGAIGEDNDYVLRDIIGLGDAEVEALVARNITGGVA